MAEETDQKRISSSGSSRKFLLSSSSSLRVVDLDPNQNPSSSSSLVVPFVATQKPKNKLSGRRIFRSLMKAIPPLQIACKWMGIWTSASSSSGEKAAYLGTKVTGTLFGYKKGHVHFVVQSDPKAEPVLILELATPTNSLVKEMASGLVRIALECERTASGTRGRLFNEAIWSMYCNGRKTGYAIRRNCSSADSHILSILSTVSMGAGVLPPPPPDEDFAASATDGELMYMRAKFERVVGSKDSEAFYMLNPDGNGGPELSIFLLRI